MRAKISDIKKTFEIWEIEFKEATERIQKSEISRNLLEKQQKETNKQISTMIENMNTIASSV